MKILSKDIITTVFANEIMVRIITITQLEKGDDEYVDKVSSKVRTEELKYFKPTDELPSYVILEKGQ